MKNNKGFSLVELIIVIAIMAILVGVMAPQLIKYIEKANVSADTQVCDAIRTAVSTTIMDPAIVTDTTYKLNTASATTHASITALINASGGGSACAAFQKNIDDLLSVAAGSEDSTLLAQLKSNGASGSAFSIYIGQNGADVLVYVAGTDASGAKSANSKPDSTKANSCIYAGTYKAGTTY